jgi:deoxyadenosine/deoxycytidine kinase
MHKIAFSGIPGSGKTSILAEVKKVLSLKSRVEDVPDSKLNSPFDFNQTAGFVSQFYFASNQINEENIRSLSHPDFQLSDGSILDHWLEWRRSLAEKKGNDQTAEKNSLLESLFRFWMPTYAVTFRIRVDAKILKSRIPKAGLREYHPDRCQQLDELYSQIIQASRIPAFDIWNHQTVDESAQEVMMQIASLKLV